MAACGSLGYIFDTPENPTLLDSLSSSWSQIKTTLNSNHQSSFTELFGELHFKENSDSQTNSQNIINNNDSECYRSDKSYSSWDPLFSTTRSYQYSSSHWSSDSFSPRNSESLQLCTEGLGFESFDDVEDLKNDMNGNWQHNEEKVSSTRHSSVPQNHRRSRLRIEAFPPLISSIGTNGKPSVSFESYRHDGRFVLKQVNISSQEFLHAHREDGRLQLHFVQPRDEIFEDENDDEEENYTGDDELEEKGDQVQHM